jgi:prepilin-type N-terminal cleavage/methylation domain-containing protein
MKRELKAEHGFTIIEVMVAAMILVIGALTTFGLLSAATRNTQRAKATQVALDRAQQEIEALRAIPNEELALTASPAHSSDSLNPNYRVSNNTFAVQRQPVGSYRNLVVNGGVLYGGSGEEGVIKDGIVSPGPVHFTSGDVSGDIYRYIVWVNDEECGDSCPGQQDYKQVIVAVKLDTPVSQSGERGYVEVQSDFIDPKDSAANDPVPDSEGNVVTAQQFYLTDTPCSASGVTERVETTGDHLLHNTLGLCANGLQTGSTPGAPDALLLGAPPDPAPADESIPALHDYSDDFELEPTPDTDKGVQIRRDSTAGCHYVPASTTNPSYRIHRWVTDPMASDFTLTEKVTIEFYSRTLNDELYTGTLCVFLFKRHESGSPLVATDTQLHNVNGNVTEWRYTPEKNSYWPQFKWERLRMTMTLSDADSPYTIPAGDRLGVALGVERSNTPADAIPIMYDHPKYPTRIEVDTSTPIEGS